mgnify:CR=1 FL=1
MTLRQSVSIRTFIDPVHANAGRRLKVNASFTVASGVQIEFPDSLPSHRPGRTNSSDDLGTWTAPGSATAHQPVRSPKALRASDGTALRAASRDASALAGF